MPIAKRLDRDELICNVLLFGARHVARLVVLQCFPLDPGT